MLECIQSTGADKCNGEVEEKKEGGGGVGETGGRHHACLVCPTCYPPCPKNDTTL